MSQHYWDTDVENVEELLRSVTNFPLHRWKCPCGELECTNFVVYGRFQQGDACKLVVMATMTFGEPPAYAAVVDLEGIDQIPSAHLLHPDDRRMYEVYLRSGLAAELKRELAKLVEVN